MQSLASVGLCQRPTFLLACLRSLFRVPQPVAGSLANARGLAVAPPDRRIPCRIYVQAIVWRIEFLPVVSTAARSRAGRLPAAASPRLVDLRELQRLPGQPACAHAQHG